MYESVRNHYLLSLLAVLGLLVPGCVPVPPATNLPPTVPPASSAVVAPMILAPGWQVHLSINQVLDQDFGSDGTLWTATTNGLVHWYPESGTYDRYPISARAVTVAPDSTLWLGTQQGAIHFDGEASQRYTTTHGLIDDSVLAIQVSADGQVWAGTEQAVSRFDGNTWVSYPTGVPVTDLAIAPNGEVWLATSRGVGRYIPTQDEWMTYSEENGLPGEHAQLIAVAPGGEVWTYILYANLYRFDGDRWHEVETVQGGTVSDIAFAADGTPWITMQGGSHYPGGTLAYFAGDSWLDVSGEDLTSFKALALGPGGDLAVGTSLGVGLFQAGEWRLLRDGPTHDRATSVAVTMDGAVWFGFGDQSLSTPGGGLSRLDSGEWQYFLGNGEVNALAAAPDGTLWVGLGSNIVRFDGHTWETVGDCENDFPACGSVLDIALTPDGGIWVANGFALLTHFDGQAWSNFDIFANSVEGGPDGSVWVNGWEGTQDSFFTARFDGSDWTFYPAGSLPGSFRAEVVTEYGLAWSLAEQRGLVSFDGEEWTVYPFAPEFEQAGPTTLDVDPDGALWVVGSDSIAVLDRFTGLTGTWTTYAMGSGLPLIYQGPIGFALDGAVWLGTTRFDPRQASTSDESPATPTVIPYQVDSRPADPTVSPAPSPTLSMKGYELYSWQADGSWYFALVIGTNRIKTYEEIVGPSVRLESFEALLAELDQLAGGEQVFWLVDRVPNMALPPQEMIDAIAAHCSNIGVNLEIVR